MVSNNISLDNIFGFSLGTGKEIIRSLDSGVLGLSSLVGHLLHYQIVETQASLFLKGRYFRFNPSLKYNFGLDDSDFLEDLVEMTDNVCREEFCSSNNHKEKDIHFAFQTLIEIAVERKYIETQKEKKGNQFLDTTTSHGFLTWVESKGWSIDEKNKTIRAFISCPFCKKKNPFNYSLYRLKYSLMLSCCVTILDFLITYVLREFGGVNSIHYLFLF